MGQEFCSCGHFATKLSTDDEPLEGVTQFHCRYCSGQAFFLPTLTTKSHPEIVVAIVVCYIDNDLFTFQPPKRLEDADLKLGRCGPLVGRHAIIHQSFCIILLETKAPVLICISNSELSLSMALRGCRLQQLSSPSHVNFFPTKPTLKQARQFRLCSR